MVVFAKTKTTLSDKISNAGRSIWLSDYRDVDKSVIYTHIMNIQVEPIELGILRQFAFSSKLQRMSVLVKQFGSDSFSLYAKGSPEMIASLCVPEVFKCG